jgi:hypothetical protein
MDGSLHDCVIYATDSRDLISLDSSQLWRFLLSLETVASRVCWRDLTHRGIPEYFNVSEVYHVLFMPHLRQRDIETPIGR